MLIEDAKDLARSRGVPEDELSAITPDSPGQYYDSEKSTEHDMTTVFLKFWKKSAAVTDENGNEHTERTVWFCQGTRDVCFDPPKDTKYRYYHIAWWSWKPKKNSFYGASNMKAYIPNQIYINKMWTMAFAFQKRMAFPARFFDNTKLQSISNKIGQAIGVQGDPKNAIWVDSPAGTMSQQAIELVKETISMTRECMGVSEAALGKGITDTAATLVALQKTTAAPLVLQQQGQHQFWEDSIIILLDLFRTNFGIRSIATEITDEESGITTKQIVDFDFSSAVDYKKLKLNIDVGASTYWSDTAAVQTVDNLFTNKIITDAVTYLNCLPDKVIPNKQKIIDELEKQKVEALPQEVPKDPQMEVPTVAKSTQLPENIDNGVSEEVHELNKLREKLKKDAGV